MCEICNCGNEPKEECNGISNEELAELVEFFKKFRSELEEKEQRITYLRKEVAELTERLACIKKIVE